MSDTPRTDAEAIGTEEGLDKPLDWRVSAAFARTLERELNAANAWAETAEKERDRLDEHNRRLTFQMTAYSVDPRRVGETELAMARVANSYASDALNQLSASQTEVARLTEELSISKLAVDMTVPWEQAMLDEDKKLRALLTAATELNAKLVGALDNITNEMGRMVPVIGYRDFTVNGNANCRRRTAISEARKTMQAARPPAAEGRERE